MKYIINTKADLDYVIDKDPEFAEDLKTLERFAGGDL